MAGKKTNTGLQRLTAQAGFMRHHYRRWIEEGSGNVLGTLDHLVRLEVALALGLAGVEPAYDDWAAAYDQATKNQAGILHDAEVQ